MLCQLRNGAKTVNERGAALALLTSTAGSNFAQANATAMIANEDVVDVPWRHWV
jgi:hypothetical protein